MVYVILIGGFLFLVLGGGLLVHGAAALARGLKVSPVIIGMFIVGFGTSAPELIIGVDAAMADQTALAMGNVIGSNIANILLVIGVCALVYPLKVAPVTVSRDGVVMLLGTLLFTAMALGGVIGRLEGALLLTLLLFYSAYAAWTEVFTDDPTAELHSHEADVVDDGPVGLGAALGHLLAGLVGVLIGADMVVESAVDIARRHDVPEVVIGLTVIAVGSSLPELATGVIAAFKRQTDVLIGNILGSNLFNLFAVMGVTAMVKPVPTPASVASTDIWVMTGVTGLFIALLVTGWRISRMEGGVLLALYIAYMINLAVA